ncbi:MAG: hypothetical protein EAX96_01255 [Candidatus Lokiarchaeota archaeon]|nr:hypothetical protein [Candidatus Lokiarchaeota archaeon]
MALDEISLKLVGGLGINAITKRTSAEIGIVHGILFRHKQHGMAIFLSTISLKPGTRKRSDQERKPTIVGGLTQEDLKEEIKKLRKQKWTPIGHIQIDIGRSAVKKFLDKEKPFALINLEEAFGLDSEDPRYPEPDLTYFI